MASGLIIGCGYLGRRVADAWLREGRRVNVLTRSAMRAAALREAGFEAFVGDVMDPASLERLPAAEIVLYAVGYDRTAGHTQRAVYVDGLRNALTALDGRVRRLVYISSTSVYGQTDGEWVDESSPCQPQQPNGQACLDAEEAVRQFFRPSGGDEPTGAVVLRLAGIYGPGRLLRRVEQVRSGEPIAGNPEAWLNLIHVDDAARAVLACEHRARAGAMYLVCDDRPVQRREYYARLSELAGAPPPAFIDDAMTAADLNKRCSNRRLRSELGVELQFPTIETGLPHACA